MCEIPRNLREILSNTCRYNIFESYLGYWGCLIAETLQIYLETSSPQCANNASKLPQGPEEMCLSLEHQNQSKTSEKMGYFDRVTVSLHPIGLINRAKRQV